MVEVETYFKCMKCGCVTDYREGFYANKQCPNCYTLMHQMEDCIQCDKPIFSDSTHDRANGVICDECKQLYLKNKQAK